MGSRAGGRSCPHRRASAAARGVGGARVIEFAHRTHDPLAKDRGHAFAAELPACILHEVEFVEHMPTSRAELRLRYSESSR